jgi:calcium/calmodulin-dependent protein kinase I
MGCCSSKPEEAEVEMKPPEPKKSTLIPVQRVSIAGASETENPLGGGNPDDIPAPRSRAPTIEQKAPHMVIDNFTDKFFVGKEMGQGAFSIVYEGTKVETGEKYALKCVRKADLEDDDIDGLVQEIEVLKQLDHPYLMNLEGLYQDEHHYIIVSELFHGGDLLQHLVDIEFYSEADARVVIRVLLEALDYCHSKNVVHRDLKLENIMLASSERKLDDIKIIDFGFAKKLMKHNERRSSCCGTPSFAAPELRTDDDFDPKACDIWSLGIISFVLLCGWPPFMGEDEDDLDDQIVECDYTFDKPAWASVSDSAKDLVTKMLTKEPTTRLTAKQLLQHGWFSKSAEEVRVVIFLLHLLHFHCRMRTFASLLQMSGGDLNGAVTGLKGMDADRKAQKVNRGGEGQEEINAVRLRAKSNAAV